MIRKVGEGLLCLGSTPFCRVRATLDNFSTTPLSVQRASTLPLEDFFRPPLAPLLLLLLLLVGEKRIRMGSRC